MEIRVLEFEVFEYILVGDGEILDGKKVSGKAVVESFYCGSMRIDDRPLCLCPGSAAAVPREQQRLCLLC